MATALEGELEEVAHCAAARKMVVAGAQSMLSLSISLTLDVRCENENNVQSSLSPIDYHIIDDIPLYLSRTSRRPQR